MTLLNVIFNKSEYYCVIFMLYTIVLWCLNVLVAFKLLVFIFNVFNQNTLDFLYQPITRT